MKRLSLGCILCLLATQFVLAHGNLSHRHAVGTLRIEQDGAYTFDLMLTLSLVGPRANLISARFDLNRDGEFSNRETSLFTKELHKEMIGGLEIYCSPNKPLVAQDVKYKANQKNRRSIVVAGLMQFVLEKPCSALTLVSRKGNQRKGLETLKVMLSAYPPLTLDDAPRVQFELKPGKSQQLSLGNKTL